MALGSTPPLTGMRGKGGRCVRLTTLPFQPTTGLKICPGLYRESFNPLNAELNPICHLLALLGAHPIFHVRRIRVNLPYKETISLKDKRI
jgi:hypothetical protein